MRELIKEGLAVEQARYLIFDQWMLQDDVDVGPVLNLEAQQAIDESLKLFVVDGWQGISLARHDTPGDLDLGLAGKRQRESTHFVEQHSKRPDVSLILIVLSAVHLRRDVIRCAHEGLGFGIGRVQHC